MSHDPHALRSLFLAGLGALDFTEEKLRDIFKELVHRGELHEKDANDLVTAWKKHAQEHRASFEGRIREIVKEELTRENLADRGEARSSY